MGMRQQERAGCRFKQVARIACGYGHASRHRSGLQDQWTATAPSDLAGDKQASEAGPDDNYIRTPAHSCSWTMSASMGPTIGSVSRHRLRWKSLMPTIAARSFISMSIS